jgi:ribosome maturation factor RimP
MNLEKIREAAERVAGSLGLEIVDVEWLVGRDRFLRVYIDRVAPPLGTGEAGAEQAPPRRVGVSHGDCQAVSDQLSVLLDVEELVPGPRYTLEVSSPGLDRKLTRPAEFERFRGRRAKISLNDPVEDSKFFEGRLAGFADGHVQLELKDRVIALPLENIRKAQLVVEF